MVDQAARYWLLHSVIHHRLPLLLLISEHLESRLNMPGHGLAVDELVTVMLATFENDELFAQRMSNFLARSRRLIDPATGQPFPRQVVGDPFCPTRAELEAGLRGLKPIDYGLTAQGGAAWEHKAQPRWERYAACSEEQDFRQPDIIIVEIVATQERIVGEFFDLFKRRTTIFIPGTEQWQVLTPWPVTYWKKLPVGYQLRFVCRATPNGPFDDPEIEQWVLRAHDWYTNPY